MFKPGDRCRVLPVDDDLVRRYLEGEDEACMADVIALSGQEVLVLDTQSWVSEVFLKMVDLFAATSDGRVWSFSNEELRLVKAKDES